MGSTQHLEDVAGLDINKDILWREGMSYQKVTGSLMANSHPGSYCGQDAYNDMFVTERNNDLYNSKAGLSYEGHVGCGIRFNGNGLQGCSDIIRGGYDENMDTAVRRLTPEECERLQGFPENWTLIGEEDEEKQERYYIDTAGKRKKVTDSARYKSLGNSIALPYWMVLARRIASHYDRDVTIGSLFDGIGGFPLAFEHCGGKAVWASEIEEFCIAVTKEHFPEE